MLLAVLQTGAVNKCYVKPALNREMIHTALSTEAGNQELLTSRERQILKLIAEQLCISVKTVETHRLNIMRKLNVHKVTELLNCSRQLGLID